MKINYQIELEKTIKNIINKDIRPKLLLHSCCAPCSSYVLEYLNKYFDITILFYNPNMIDKEEFEKRFKEQVKISDGLSSKNKINLVKITYDNELFLSAVRDYENIAEGGKRCEICFELRLRESAIYASKNKFDYFTTTLSISPLKNAQLLNQIGILLENEYDVIYLKSDFKKKGGYKRSVELSSDYELYRQDYCGCIFSKAERDNRNKKG